MRAGVGAVQHTLTPAAAAVVRAAVAEAKTRGHSQVQPLHVAAILLIQSSPGSPLRRACLQSHNKDLSHPLQCRALELCFKIALDRLPSNQEKSSNPVLSNALVAALKRAQAHQRRGTPEQSLQPLLAVKVEMDQLIISILDDPSVSRVMREAGFSSTDVKSNMEESAAQQSSSLTCSSSSLDSSSQLRRHERLPMTNFAGSPFENGQFRHSLFSSAPSLMFEASGNNVRMERGLLSNVGDAKTEKESPLLSSLHRQDSDGHSFSPLAPPFLQKSPVFLNRPEQSRLHPQLPVSLNRSSVGSTGHEEDVRNVVETLLKKKSPVLVSEAGLQNSNLVVKEFSQRLKTGDVPAFLKGVQFLNFPYNSLTVGLFSEEEMQQKLTQLRGLVEGSMPGGAILSLGDLQWLAESAQGKTTVTHAHAHLAIQELSQFLNVYSSQRFWLLGTASSETYTGCQVGNPSLESRLNLQPIIVAVNSSLGFQSRHGSHQLKIGGPLTSPGQKSPVNPLLTKLTSPGVENSADSLGCCPECTSKYQNELSRLIRQERVPLPGLASPPSSTLPWMSQPKDMNWPPLAAVKEEGDVLTHNPLLSQRIKDLKEKWRRICSGHSVKPGGLCTVTDSARSFLSSSQARPGSILTEDKSSSLMSKMMCISRWPETAKFLVSKSAEQPSAASSKVGNLQPWTIRPSAVSSLSNGATANVHRNSDGPSVGIGGWMKKIDPSGALDSSNLSSSPAHPTKAHRDTMGADLALGRSSVEVSSPARDLREDGQQPLLGEMKLSNCGNSRNGPVPEVILPWRVPALAGTDFLKASEQKTPSSIFFRPNDMDCLKGLWRGLQDMVPWQRDAGSAVASTVSDCRSGNGRKRGSATKSDTWLLFLGPDRVGKKEVARALAKLVFGDEKKLILMQLRGRQVDAAPFGPNMGAPTSDNNGVRYRGKTPLDRLAEAVRLKPFSVVLLEDVDQADSVVRGNLLKAMQRGKLASSNGKEVSFANVIVIMTCNVGGSQFSPKRNFEGQGALIFEEEKLSRLPSYGMQFQVEESRCERILHDSGSGVSVVNFSLDLEISSLEQSSSPSLSCKRRAHWALEGASDRSLRDKRPRKEGSVSSKALALDLNLSVEENESVDELSCTTDVNTPDRPAEQETEETLAKKVIACARESLPKDMLDLADARVIFRPFDFAALTDGVLDHLESSSRTILNTGATVEIDVAALEQLVSAAWHTISDRNVFSSWVNDVLVKSLASLSEDCQVRDSSVVKLTIDRGQALEMQQETGAVRVGLLPASIKLV